MKTKEQLYLLHEDSSCITDKTIYSKCSSCPKLIAFLYKLFPQYTSSMLRSLEASEEKGS